jgi:pilus assembly protein Flp/PilA
MRFDVKALFKRFVADDCGATVIEYSLIATFIGIAIIVSVQSMGVALVGTFTFIQSAL